MAPFLGSVGRTALRMVVEIRLVPAPALSLARRQTRPSTSCWSWRISAARSDDLIAPPGLI
jgi:hypothetical protein